MGAEFVSTLKKNSKTDLPPADTLPCHRLEFAAQFAKFREIAIPDIDIVDQPFYSEGRDAPELLDQR
jgi:hypothetical protein